MCLLSNRRQKNASKHIDRTSTPKQGNGALKNAISLPIPKSLSWVMSNEAKTSPKFGARWFGKAPWYRKDSGDTIDSVSSSIREVLAGRTPPVTPNPEDFFSRQLEYSTSPYPAGEATRVRTPPVHKNAVDGTPRSFFSDVVPPGVGNDTWNFGHLKSSAEEEQQQNGCKKNVLKNSKEWWEVKRRTRPKKALPGPQAFQFDIPEHLPSSPICPTNILHPSGGKGLCVYHGRRRTSSALRVEQAVGERRQGSEVSITSQNSEV
ncbi:uncharacterized protein CTRU02_202287 [Colletotrichum truncatum]|uniref:Uncharacterized protein n=1 Tax=Colletotrichum truncatum TaxID=5467 RepID=A0ACC3ZK18_COLTU|nr:uncharacterized protein CTRU02_01447 [Colletotrichum truncatum]KAF6799768.1 hypothetical protein CTRU02_01447 [Colletotrichum truncatum]